MLEALMRANNVAWRKLYKEGVCGHRGVVRSGQVRGTLGSPTVLSCHFVGSVKEYDRHSDPHGASERESQFLSRMEPV